jgi:hypothetical protein
MESYGVLAEVRLASRPVSPIQAENLCPNGDGSASGNHFPTDTPPLYSLAVKTYCRVVAMTVEALAGVVRRLSRGAVREKGNIFARPVFELLPL